MAQYFLSQVVSLLWLAAGATALGAAAAPSSRAGTVPITFEVTVPPETPSGAEVWLSGNVPELGAWNGAGVKLSRGADGRYTAQVPLPLGTALEFKVTRGAWDTVEKSASGEEVPNRAFHVGSRAAHVTVTVSRWADSTSAPSSLTGTVRYLRGVTSKFLSRPRDIIVWLPPGYDAHPQRHYPVLYMHDGQNLMDTATAFSGGEWHVDETAQRLVRDGKVEPLIVVGVYNTEARIPEYTEVPGTGDEAQYGGGEADAYGRFLVEELKPRIDHEFRTRPGAQDTGLMGSSLGGLVTMYLGLKYPDVFRRLGVVSATVMWGDRDIVKRVDALKKKPPLRIWMDIGTSEYPGSEETVGDAQLLRDALVRKGWVLGRDLKYVEVPGAFHTESAWAARFGDILQYLFPGGPSHP